MEINMRFNSTVPQTDANSLIQFRSNSDPNTTEALSYEDTVSFTQEAAALQSETDQPLSDAQLEYLYDIYLQLGDEDEFYGRIGALLNEMSGEDRTNFLATLSLADDDLKEVVLRTEALEGEDRSVFLRTAVRLDPGDDLGNFLEAVEKTSGTTQSNFLSMADQLNQSAKSIRANELGNFIAAAAGSPSAVSALTAKTLELQEDEENRENLLAAAANSGKDLGNLLAITDRLDPSEQRIFLVMAANAGRGISMMISLSSSLNHSEQMAMLETASMLETSDVENFFLATQGKTDTLSKLSAATNGLSGQNQSRFLSIAAKATDTLSPLMDVMAGLDAPSGEMDQFLSAADKAGDNLSGFVDMVQATSGEGRSSTLSMATELSVPDLASFITAARNNDAATLAETAGEFSGKEQSWFLYAASQVADSRELVSQLDELSENEKSDFLFTAANTGLNSELDSEELFDNLDQMDDSERADFLAAERARIYAETGGDAEYVYLASVFDQTTIDAMLDSTAGMDAMLDKIDGMDADNRDVFMSLVSTAGEDLISDLLDVTDTLGNEDLEEFMAFADTLTKKNLGNYIQTVQATTAGTADGSSRLQRITDMAGQMSGAIREDFLYAAATAGDSLDDFMDMTAQLGGMQQVNFLIAADNIADGPGGEQLMSDFIEGTQNLITESKKAFWFNAGRLDRDAGSLLLDNKIKNVSSFRVTSYLKSAAWITDAEIDYTQTEKWIKSYLPLE